MFKIVGLLIGIGFIAYYFFINKIEGKTTFTSFYLISGISIVIYSIIINKLLRYEMFSKIYNPLKNIFSIGIVIFVIIEVLIILYPKKKVVNCDYVIVLGSGIRGDKLTLTLKDRLLKTLEYLKKSEFKGKIVLSGGQGHDESITEASAMEKFLFLESIDKKRLLLEEKSTNTYENLKFSKLILEEDSEKNIENLKVLIITTDFHGMRSAFLAKRNGYKDINLYTSKSKWYLIPTMYVREFFALVKSFLFDRN